MKRDETKQAMNLLDAFSDALGRSDGQSLEEVRQDLVDEGIDLESAGQRFMEMVHSASTASKRKALDLARERRLHWEPSGDSLLDEIASWSKEKLLGRIREILSPKDLAASASYRNLEAKKKEDLVSLLQDLELTLQRSKSEDDKHG